MLPKIRFSALLYFATVSSLCAQVNTGARASSAVPDFSKEAYVIEELSTRITAEQDGTGIKELSLLEVHPA